MKEYIIRRLLQSLLVLLLATFLVFMVLRLLPGDPILTFISQSQFNSFSLEKLEELRELHGLNKPLMVQYVYWLGDLLQGDMGQSIIRQKPVSRMIGEALPKSLYLGIISLILANLIAIPVGIVCAARRGTWIDTILTIFANIGITAPVFWLGILLIFIFGLLLGWLPTHGYTSPFNDFGDSTLKLIMPVACLALMPLAMTVRQTRSAMLEVIRQDYIRTAWSKGLTERIVIFRHAFKNGMLPVVTLIGASLGHIVGGEVLVETIFAIPGLGKLAVDGLLSRDYAVVQGVVLIITAVVVLSNLAVDISYGWLNPKVRYH